jgi:hypothetical protein
MATTGGTPTPMYAPALAGALCVSPATSMEAPRASDANLIMEILLEMRDDTLEPTRRSGHG